MTEHDLTGALTISEFCKNFGIGRTFAYAEIKAARLAACKAGKKTLILRAEAQRWATSLPKLHATAEANVSPTRHSTSESNPERAAPSES